jgi:hypothetical protein
MAQFKLTIECDNAAFDDEPCFEVARILREAAERILNMGTIDHGVIRDINGNRVGSWDFTD